MLTLIKSWPNVVLALLLVLVGLATVATFAPQVHAASSPAIPNYILCSRLGRTVTQYGSTQKLGDGDTGQPSIEVWYDSVQSSYVCQEQANVLWTTSICGRTITVYFTNGVGGNKTSNLVCNQTLTYSSNIAYSDGCAFYMSATTSDNYQLNWSYSPFC